LLPSYSTYYLSFGLSDFKDFFHIPCCGSGDDIWPRLSEPYCCLLIFPTLLVSPVCLVNFPTEHQTHRFFLPAFPHISRHADPTSMFPLPDSPSFKGKAPFFLVAPNLTLINSGPFSLFYSAGRLHLGPFSDLAFFQPVIFSCYDHTVSPSFRALVLGPIPAVPQHQAGFYLRLSFSFPTSTNPKKTVIAPSFWCYSLSLCSSFLLNLPFA